MFFSRPRIERFATVGLTFLAGSRLRVKLEIRPISPYLPPRSSCRAAYCGMLRSILQRRKDGARFRTAQTAWNCDGFAHILDTGSNRYRLLTSMPITAGGC
nr:hypothetical protein [Mesorhizobium loti]